MCDWLSAMADRQCVGSLVELALQIVGSEIVPVFSVPLPALLPVPLAFTLLVSAGHLTVFEPGVRHKPAPTDPARPLPCGGSLHRFLLFG